MSSANSSDTNNHFISLQKAVELTKRYRTNRESVLDPALPDKNILPLSDTLPRNVFDVLLAKPGCTSIRIYYGMDAGLNVKPVVVAVNAQNQDILPGGESGSNLENEGEDIGDDALRCPPFCPPPSPLNEG